jgi:hypothetical protein
MIRPAAVCLALTLVAAGTGVAHASCGVLHALAQQHASDMARRNSLDHDGFFTQRGPRGAMAENVAVGCATEACARDVWMKSPPHRANMMLGGCQAVASAVSKNGHRYWAMEIGSDAVPERLAGARRVGRSRHAVKGDAKLDNFNHGAEAR